MPQASGAFGVFVKMNKRVWVGRCLQGRFMEASKLLGMEGEEKGQMEGHP